MPRPLLVMEMGLPELLSAGKVLCWEKQFSQKLGSVCARGGKIVQVLPSGLGNIHQDGPFQKNPRF